MEKLPPRGRIDVVFIDGFCVITLSSEDGRSMSIALTIEEARNLGRYLLEATRDVGHD